MFFGGISLHPLEMSLQFKIYVYCVCVPILCSNEGMKICHN
jgi:hypothetical protein